MKRLLILATLFVVCTSSSQADETRRETEMVSSAEGIELATEIYHPKSEPAPVILIRTPYGREGLDFLAEALVPQGYVVAIQDVRGRYGSTGTHEPFRHERVDGLASLNWLAQQEWCNGKIGMWGSSYSGYAALAVADAEIPAFQSIFSISGWVASGEVLEPGGATHLLLNLPWMLTQQGRKQRNLAEFDIDELFRHVPLRDALKAAGIHNPDWEDPSWIEELKAKTLSGKVTRPTLHLTGWHDMVYRATLDAWQRQSAVASAPQRLIIGPWWHNQFLFGEWEVGDANFGHASGLGMDEVTALSLRWFDATLKGKKNGALKGPPVSYFMMGQNAWQEASAWPPPAGITRQRWYLESGGSANSLSGDGVLSSGNESQAEADSFLFDPMNPVPTLGGAQFTYFPDLLGVRDQRDIEKRDDVLVFTSAPLIEPMQITGGISAHLTVATSAPSTDFTAKLVVVRPDGYARIVEEGIARVTRPAGGEPFGVTIDVGQTAIQVPAGSRLRAEISSSNFPKYDRNPNTGVDPFLATEFKTASQTVLHSQEHPSYIELTVQKKLRVASAAGKEPIIAPVATATTEVATIDSDDPAELLALGREQLEEREPDQAIATLSRAVELAPERSDMHLWLGRAYRDKLQTVSLFKKLSLSKKTRASYLKAVELDPTNTDARSSLASFYFNAPAVAGGDEKKGIEQVEAIRQQDPHAAHLLMAGLYRDRKEPDKAKEEYLAAIALEPEEHEARYQLGVLYQTDKQWEEALEMFASALRLGDDMRALYQIGRTGALSGEYLQQGLEAFDKYLEIDPQSPVLPGPKHVHWRMGMIYEHRQDAGKARAEYEMALKLDPEMEQPRVALERMDVTRAAVK